MSYVTVMGLEIHAELLTNSKAYCSCENSFAGKKNERICPVCAGFPGTLPAINKKAVELAVMSGLCFDCKINNYSAFDRKNYFYPDLPKAYQITQFYHPICLDGIIRINEKSFGIERIHIEEDAGKLIHSDTNTLIDYNRCGVPLIEIVTHPDFRNANEVCQFIEEIALRLKYAGVCDAKLEEGSLRVDVNISVMKESDTKFGTRAEIKNLNSLKSVRRAIEYEATRQSMLLDEGKNVILETRRFDESSGKTISLRPKEKAEDYRYFPEPDLPPIFISDDDIKGIKGSMPEMPHVKFDRYTRKYKLTDTDAGLIIYDKSFAEFYDKAVSILPEYKEISKLMLGEVNRNLNNTSQKIDDVYFSPCDIAKIVKMSIDNTITANGAKELVRIMFREKGSPEELARKYNLLTTDNTEELKKICSEVLSENSQQVTAYKNGNDKLFAFFIGQCVRRAGKCANPKLIKEILETLLN